MTIKQKHLRRQIIQSIQEKPRWCLEVEVVACSLTVLPYLRINRTFLATTHITAEADRARSELAEEARWRTQLQQDLADLKAELQGAQQEPAHMHSPGSPWASNARTRNANAESRANGATRKLCAVPA